MYGRGEKSAAVYNWTNHIRYQYANGKLDEEKIKRLKEINFSFESNRKKTDN
jgi:hypothetical protein